ncbi:hypothetical protein HAX54_043924 [Datura stramonium]|uniref:Uncharacterized protein n=1 Tax=Datura stramonium TaxID=4076 RepID=A0ABS8W3X6_DATST|nr:hypothetical protein [Datura stramonium]
MGFLARERFCDMDAQPNSVGRLAHLTDDEISTRFDRISFFLTIQNSGADQDLLASPVWPCLESEPLCVESRGAERSERAEKEAHPQWRGREGLRGPRLSISSLWREVSFVSRVCWGGQGRWIGSRGDAYASSFSIGFPSFSVYGEGARARHRTCLYPQPPSVISNLTRFFLFTSTLRATTSSPLYRLGKAMR